MLTCLVVHAKMAHYECGNVRRLLSPLLLLLAFLLTSFTDKFDMEVLACEVFVITALLSLLLLPPCCTKRKNLTLPSLHPTAPHVIPCGTCMQVKHTLCKLELVLLSSM